MAAAGAVAWSVIFAIPSFYWAAGGTLGTGTIAASRDALGVAGEPWAVATTGVMKLVGGVLAVALMGRWERQLPRRFVLVSGLAAGVFLTLYGVASMVQHGLMVAGAIDTPEVLGSYAARWHFLFWDPWWILGGVLFTMATRAYQRRRP